MQNVSTSKSSVKVRRLVLAGLFSALIYVFTAYLHVPTGAGYTHAGDGLIYLAASILPVTYAAAAGAIGAGLADGLSGFAVWIPATIIIKAVTATFFTNKNKKIICLRNLIAIVPSLILCVLGYSLYESIVISKGFSKAVFIAALAQTPAYCVQVTASSILYIAAGTALDKMNIKHMLSDH